MRIHITFPSFKVIFFLLKFKVVVISSFLFFFITVKRRCHGCRFGKRLISFLVYNFVYATEPEYVHQHIIIRTGMSTTIKITGILCRSSNIYFMILSEKRLNINRSENTIVHIGMSE